MKILFFSLLMLLLSVKCEEDCINCDHEPGIFDSIELRWTIYVKDLNTNQPIANATVEWDQINLGAGSIVYPKSGTTDSNGTISVTITVDSRFTSINVNIRRVFVPSGAYYAFTGLRTITPRENNPATTTFYLTHII